MSRNGKGAFMKMTLLKLLAEGSVDADETTWAKLERYFFPVRRIAVVKKDSKGYRIVANQTAFWTLNNQVNRHQLIVKIIQIKSFGIKDAFDMHNRIANDDAYGMDKEAE